MLEQFGAKDELYQDDAAYRIAEKFGNDFVYINDNGNLAIGKPVLREFRKLTEGVAVWERSERRWRRRLPSDLSGRAAD